MNNEEISAPGVIKASGKECNKAVANKTPTDRLTILLTILDRTVKDKLAAAAILNTPATVVARMIQNNVIQPLVA
jgi:hypothetical protein